MKKTVKNNNKSERKYVNILGINIDSTNINEVLAGVEDKTTHNNKFSILTPNPELILQSLKHRELQRALNSADFSVPDGVGLKIASPGLNIIKGRELFLKLIELANKKGWKVFFLGGMGDEAELAAKKLGIRNQKLGISFAGGPEVTSNLHKDIVDKINKFNPDLLFVALGNPKQEIFVHEYLSKLKTRGMMAVGGTFRYVAGLSPIPPKWISQMGLEWLWRLITEPYRVKRIWNAVVIFPLKVFQSKISE